MTTTAAEQDLSEELAALGRLTVNQLADRYAALYGCPARTRHKAYLVRKVAWRLQARAEDRALAMGTGARGLQQEMRRLLTDVLHFAGSIGPGGRLVYDGKQVIAQHGSGASMMPKADARPSEPVAVTVSTTPAPVASPAEVRVRLDELKSVSLDWAGAGRTSAASWWERFEAAHAADLAPVLAVAEHLRARGATIEDLFVACGNVKPPGHPPDVAALDVWDRARNRRHGPPPPPVTAGVVRGRIGPAPQEPARCAPYW
jgi:hypothetical protein